MLLRVTERDELIVTEREEWAVECRVDGVGVVGPLDGAECITKRDDLFALVEAPTTNENVRNASSFESTNVRTSDIATEALQALEEKADVLRFDRGFFGGSALGDRPATRTNEPIDVGADRIGKGLFDLVVDDLGPLVFAVRTRHRKRDNRGAVLGIFAMRREWNVGSL